MSEPEARVTRWVELPAGVRHGSVQDERIRFRSETYLIPHDGGIVWVDPLLPATEAVAALGEVQAVCLTGPVHQRAAWTVRRQLGVPVWAPRGSAVAMMEAPDREYDDGAVLPGGLRARSIVGPSEPHAMLGRTGGGAASVWWVGDVVMRQDDGPMQLAPRSHQADPAGLVESVRVLRSLQPTAIYPAHGAPWIAGAAQPLAELWRRLEAGAADAHLDGAD